MMQRPGPGRTRELEIIVAVSSALREAGDRRHLIATLLAQLQQYLPADGLAYARYDAGLLELEQHYGGWHDCNLAEIGTHLNCGNETIAHMQLPGRGEQPFVVILIPLVLSGHCFGALLLQRRDVTTTEEQGILKAIAQIATHALSRASLHEETVQLNQALARREQLLHHMLESMPAGLLVVDEQLMVVTANQVFQQMWPDHKRDLVGATLAEVLPEALVMQTGLLPHIQRVLEQDQASETYRFVCRCDPESPQIYDYRIVPIKNAAATASVLFIFENVTERQRLEMQLNHSATMESLGIMAGSIAHELRNPLSIISTTAQIMTMEATWPPLARECAQRIDNASRRAERIIENLLRFTRLTDHQIEPCCLNTIIEESMGLVAHQLLMDRIELQLDLSRELPPIQGSPQLLQQVFVNLSVNATRAMTGGGTLHISTRPDGGGTLLAEVRDTGCGIASNRLARIFDPFFTTKPGGEGTGLGLAICAKIIREHGGQIRASSRPGAGTSFFISLPCVEEPAVSG